MVEIPQYVNKNNNTGTRQTFEFLLVVTECVDLCYNL